MADIVHANPAPPIQFAYYDGTNLADVLDTLGLTVSKAPKPGYPAHYYTTVLVRVVSIEDERVSVLQVADMGGDFRGPTWVGCAPDGILVGGKVQHIVVADDDGDGAPVGFTVTG